MLSLIVLNSSRVRLVSILPIYGEDYFGAMRLGRIIFVMIFLQVLGSGLLYPNSNMGVVNQGNIPTIKEEEIACLLLTDSFVMATGSVMQSF